MPVTPAVDPSTEELSLDMIRRRERLHGCYFAGFAGSV